MQETMGTLDLISLELDLDFALDELRGAVAGLEQARHAAEDVRSRVTRVQNRVIWSRSEVEANLQDLAVARQVLEELEADTQEARRMLEAYIQAWSRKADTAPVPSGLFGQEQAQGAA